MRTRRRIAAALAIAATTLAVGAVVLPATTASATPASPATLAAPKAPAGGGGLCVDVDPVTKKCRKSIPIPGRPGEPPGHRPPGNGEENSGPFTGCRWEPYEGVYPGPPQERPPGVSPDAVYSIHMCYKDGFVLYCPCITDWIEPGLVQQATPLEVAQSIDVEALLHAPHLVVYPPGGKPSLVTAPVFVAVDNWQGDVTDHGCLGAVCVDILAHPTLTYTPGDGADTIVCEPGGTHFDMDGADPMDQARAQGACAHSYTKRTSVDGRPDAWPAEVTITWEITWAGGGQNGGLPDVVQTTPFAQAVGELQGVVTGAG
jgi:hypothetical protein